MFADFLLINETPVFLGGYATYYKSDNFTEGLRIQSLKGLLRYWLRAYLAGAGMEIKEIKKKTCKLLGGRVDKEAFASRIQIKSRIIEEEPYIFDDKRIPRVNLLLRKRQKLDCARLLKVRLSLNERLGINLSGNEKGLIIGSLLTSLLLSGLGKMGRRGFGTFKIDMQEDGSGLFYNDINNIIFNKNTSDKERKEAIIRIIENTKKNIIDEKPIKNIPPIHAIHKKYFKLIYVPIMEKPEDIISKLQRFTLRSERTKVILGNFRARDEITKKHLAWFLGLPRTQRSTGYIIEDKQVQRRSSPIFFSVHKDFALISLFLSSDWPANLKWKGVKEVQLPIELNAIREAYEVVFNLLKKYLEKLNYEYEVIYGD
ncbi:MAG: type III-B CRISPR module RAMP protein Cmr1 [Candidatus Aenigmatarchaeota archaeon]